MGKASQLRQEVDMGREFLVIAWPIEGRHGTLLCQLGQEWDWGGEFLVLA
jgi:hypothetical protein